METSDARVPVTLLTGFPGAGKTTLPTHLLRDPAAGRAAVVTIELGEAGVDHDMIEEATDETVPMQAGCLCCSLRGDLGRTLASLVAHRLRGLLDFERVVIETTGIADPGPILQTLVLDEVIAPHYRLDGVVTVADAPTGPDALRTRVEARRQVALADLIALGKTDLVTPPELRRFEAQLAAINDVARHVRADRGHVPGDALLGLSACRADAAGTDIAAGLGMAGPGPMDGPSGAAPGAGGQGAGARPRHDSRIGAIARDLDRTDLAEHLEALRRRSVSDENRAPGRMTRTRRMAA
jgi:G3E family GTPase